MANFNFKLSADSAIREYDNTGAYNQLMAMMKRGEFLNVKFFVRMENKVPCAWIESKSTAGFTYELKTESFNGLLAYMMDGAVTDFDTNPKEVDTWNEESDFTLQMMIMLIDTGKRLQYVPLFRESPEYITAFLSCLKGKIMFRIKRDEPTLELLREKGQNI